MDSDQKIQTFMLSVCLQLQILDWNPWDTEYHIIAAIWQYWLEGQINHKVNWQAGAELGQAQL